MEDFSVATLAESKNEWCARLVSIMAPAVTEGIRAIFKEALDLCKSDDEDDQYLMTFQTFLKRIPNWNDSIISNERTRIEETSGCKYLEDLITCVHIVQLKALSCIRVSKDTKKVEIQIPAVDKFVHNVYKKCAAKVYRNAYLFELDLEPLTVQKHNRELEVLLQEGILEAVRDSMPVEELLKAYMAEQEVSLEASQEPGDVEETKALPEPPVAAPAPVSTPVAHATDPAPGLPKPAPSLNFATPPPLVLGTGRLKSIEPETSLKFDDIDYSLDESGKEEKSVAPKSIERLEAISEERNAQRKLEEAEEEADMSLKIGEEVKLELDSLSVASKHKGAPVLDIETLS